MLKAHEEQHEPQKHQTAPGHIALHVLRGKPHTDILTGADCHIDERGHGKGNGKGDGIAQQNGKFRNANLEQRQRVDHAC